MKTTIQLHIAGYYYVAGQNRLSTAFEIEREMLQIKVMKIKAKIDKNNK